MLRRAASLVAAAALSMSLIVGSASAAEPVAYGTTLERSTLDRPDDTAERQVHVMYVVPRDGADRALDTNGTLKNSVSSFQRWLAAKTKGKALRFDTFNGSLDITFFRLSRTDSEIASNGPFVRDQLESELKQAGRLTSPKIYAVYYDGRSTFSCGGGAWPPALPGTVAALYLNGLPDAPVSCSSNAFATAGAPPTYLEFAMLHEIFHTVGFVPTCAPHHVRSGHVSDDPNDLMWAGDGNWAPAGWANVVLDSGHDDYYNAHVRGCLDFRKSPLLAKWRS